MNDMTANLKTAEPQRVRGPPGHSTVGTDDLEAAAQFYNRLMAVFGIGRFLVQPGRAVYHGERTPEFGVIKPFDGTAGQWRHGGVRGTSRAQVRDAHATAPQAGGSDEGAPGPRGENGEGPYCAYFRDPEGILVHRAGPDKA
ncbi:VOC family protein [Rhizobium mesosinicum]|uniref:VOC family protein n=1 Tax=Rhizobium mesosinicum TaxID=335017 RepID=A0ABS7GYX9_9HYPH|nr:VOC family protein [Rhizobium mesosinicum]MBW9054746.1 VOC family protein [Rhizobium mesosinicum]